MSSRRFGWTRTLGLPLLAVAALVAGPVARSAGSGPPVEPLSGAALQPAASISPNPATGPTTNVHLFGFNDYHGAVSKTSTGNADGVPAGGSAQFAKVLGDLRAANPNNVSAAAGDLVGATLLSSALFNDEPALDIYSAMGVDYSSVGNHEFDEGRAELLRKQNGGCTPNSDGQSCTFKDPADATPSPTTTYPGTTMRYLAANVVDTGTGQPVLPPTAIKEVGGVKIGFIGLVLRATPTIVTPSGVAGLTFLDEASTANSYVPSLRAAGAETIVVLVHQGGFQSGGGTNVNTCNNLGGDIVPLVKALDSHIPVVVSGHTHAAYNCSLPTPQGAKLVTSALANGRVISDIGMTLNSSDGTLVQATANNVIVNTAANTLAPGDPARTPMYNRVEALTAAANSQSAALAGQVIGTINADITRSSGANGESALGDVIADAQLRATDATRIPAASAVIAFMNPGGIRADLTRAGISDGEQVGEVTYREAFGVQPFGNSLVTKSLTGDQIRRLLNQQLAGCYGQLTQRTLQVSAGFTYTLDRTRPSLTPNCDSVDPASIRLNGTPLDPATSYRVTMNSFLASGGDGFAVFNEGTDVVGGPQDIDALGAYFGADPNGVDPGPRNRISFVPGPNPVSGPDPVIPEVPYAVILPLLAMLLIGGALVVGVHPRRRTAGF